MSEITQRTEAETDGTSAAPEPADTTAAPVADIATGEELPPDEALRRAAAGPEETAQARDRKPSDTPDDAAAESRSRDGCKVVADIRVNRHDSEEREIIEIYGRSSKLFAVYRVKGGDVWVQFADDQSTAAKQRAAVAKLCGMRWDLDKLADGWRREQHYHHELAGGLQLALTEEQVNAEGKISHALAALKEERQRFGRIYYMGFATITAVALLLLLSLGSELIMPLQQPQENFWLAGKAGLVGAYFSIALAIRGRTVALDNDWMGNALEGAVRLIIGVIAGGFLLLAFGSGLVTDILSGGTSPTNTIIKGWQHAAVLGFLGGFAERMVPDLLKKTGTTGNETGSR
jgi:hypothetical protein